MCGHTAGLRTFLGAQLLVTVMVDLMVKGLYDMGCWWADIGALPGPLVCLNQAP